MTQTLKRILAFSALILWMIVIFMFSSQNGEESQKTSSGIVESVVETVVEDFHELPEKEKNEIFTKFSFSIRTLAHFIEFTVLGILALIASLTVSLPERLRNRQILWRIVICALFCLLYACSDELHQMFSDGRSAQLLDICVDFAGSLSGIGITVLIINCFNNGKKKKGMEIG